MKGFTQVKNLIGVIFVTRNFISSNQGRVMKEKTFQRQGEDGGVEGDSRQLHRHQTVHWMQVVLGKVLGNYPKQNSSRLSRYETMKMSNMSRE